MGYEIRIEPYTYTAGKERRKQLPFPAVLCTVSILFSALTHIIHKPTFAP